LTKSSAPSYARFVEKSRPVHLDKVVRAILAARILMTTVLLCTTLSVSAVDGRDGAIGKILTDIISIGSRAEGTIGESRTMEYIGQTLKAAGLSSDSIDFSQVRDGYSSSRIIETRIRGAREDELAILVPVNSWVDAPVPSEGAFGIALALSEALRLSKKTQDGEKSPISLRFVFLGAEKRGRKADGEMVSLGSKTWIARQAGRARLAVLYLNMEDAPSRLAVRSAGDGVLSPYWFYEGVRRALETSGIGYSLEANRLQAYRLGLASDYGAAAGYLEADIPAIELRGDSIEAIGVSATGWFEKFVTLFMSEERGGFAETWDRHYFIFQIGKLSAVLREKNYVAFLVLVFAVVASSFLIATVARRKAAKQLLHRIPTMMAEVTSLFLVLAIVFLAGKGIAKLDALVLGSVDAWRLSPRIFAAARILFSFFLFLSLLSFLVELRLLSSNPFFYEFAALFCLAIDSLAFSAADLSASFYFMWALVFVEISLASRKRWVTLVAYVLMYVPLIVIAQELAVRPELSSYRKLIAPEYLDVIYLSALTFPFFVFTVSPLLFYARRGARARRRMVVLFAACALSVEAFALMYSIVSTTLSGTQRRDLGISELIDQDTGKFEVELTGLRRLGKGSLECRGTRFEYDSMGDRAYLGGDDKEARIGIKETVAPFLDRIDDSISIRFGVPPYRVDIALEASDAILVYDCNFPYKVAVDGRSAVIYPGVNPGETLGLSLTVSSSFHARLVVKAWYLASLETYTQSAGASLTDKGLAIRASFVIGSGRK